MPKPQPDPRAREGSVLIFCLIIMLLMALMGFALTLNTQRELQITQNNNAGMSAFSKADAAARLGVLMARASLNPSGGAPEDLINPYSSGGSRPPFEVRLVDNFTSDSIIWLSESLKVQDIQARYLRATGADGYEEPRLTMLYDQKVAGTATVEFNMADNDPARNSGFSLAETQGYNAESGSATVVYLIVAANGRLPAGDDADGGNYFSGDVRTTHSVINTIFREIRLQ